VQADEIFILLLIVVSVGAVAASAVRSRRHQKIPDAQGSPTEDEEVRSQQPRMDEERDERQKSDASTV
jgi:hypothetical protein